MCSQDISRSGILVLLPALLKIAELGLGELRGLPTCEIGIDALVGVTDAMCNAALAGRANTLRQNVDVFKQGRNLYKNIDDTVL